MQPSTELKVLYPLYPPLGIDSEAATNLYHQFFNDYGSTRATAIRGSFVHNGEGLAVTVRSCTAEEKNCLFKNARLLPVGGAVLEFSGNLKFPGQDKFFWTDQAGAKISRTMEQSISDWKSFLPGDLELTIQTYFCALAIAYQGAVRPTASVWIVDGSEIENGSVYLSEVHEAIEFFREHNALPEIEVDVQQVIKWTFAQNGMFDGYSDTPASRALNYFTRLFVCQFRNDELSDLVWALAGIEALLVEGGRSSMGQLREKLSALFSETVDLPWLSKMISDSYNFRSRMIHGDRQIWSSCRDGEEESAKRFDEAYNSRLFVIGTLICLLRFVISKNLKQVSFETVLRK